MSFETAIERAKTLPPTDFARVILRASGSNPIERLSTVAAHLWHIRLDDLGVFNDSHHVTYAGDYGLFIDSVFTGIDPMDAVSRTVAATCEVNYDAARAFPRIQVMAARASSLVFAHSSLVAWGTMGDSSEAAYTPHALEVATAYTAAISNRPQNADTRPLQIVSQ